MLSQFASCLVLPDNHFHKLSCTYVLLGCTVYAKTSTNTSTNVWPEYSDGDRMQTQRTTLLRPHPVYCVCLSIAVNLSAATSAAGVRQAQAISQRLAQAASCQQAFGTLRGC